MIAGGQFALYDRKQFGNRSLDAERYAAGNRLAHAADEARERDAFALRFEIPYGVLKGRLGHWVTAHGAKDARAIAAMLRRFGGQHGRKLVQEHQPGGVGRLGGEERVLAGGALAPARQALRLDLGQNDPPVASNAKAGLEGADQRHVQFAQDDCIDSHLFLAIGQS